MIVVNLREGMALPLSDLSGESNHVVNTSNSNEAFVAAAGVW